MLTRTLAARALAITLSVPAAAQTQPAPVAPSPVKRTILQKTDVPGTNLEMIYATVEIAAGFKAGRHFHPGTVMAQVVEGEFWLQLDGQPETILKAGESLTCRTQRSTTKARPIRR